VCAAGRKPRNNTNLVFLKTTIHKTPRRYRSNSAARKLKLMHLLCLLLCHSAPMIASVLLCMLRTTHSPSYSSALYAPP